MVRCSLLLALALSACGRVNYDGLDGGGPGVIDGAQTDAGRMPPDADGITPDAGANSFALTSTCSGSAETVLTVPVGKGQPAGTRLLVRVVIRDGSFEIPSASDSAGNTYGVDVSAQGLGPGTKTHIHVLSTTLTSPLRGGDTVTVTHEDELATGVALDTVDFASSLTSSTASGESDTPSGSHDATSGGVMLAVIGLSNHTSVDLPAAWTPLPPLLPSCGGAPGNADGFAAILTIDSSQTVPFDATIGTARIWSLGMIHYAPN